MKNIPCETFAPTLPSFYFIQALCNSLCCRTRDESIIYLCNCELTLDLFSERSLRCCPLLFREEYCQQLQRSRSDGNNSFPLNSQPEPIRSFSNQPFTLSVRLSRSAEWCPPSSHFVSAADRRSRLLWKLTPDIFSLLCSNWTLGCDVRHSWPYSPALAVWGSWELFSFTLCYHLVGLILEELHIIFDCRHSVSGWGIIALC